VVDVLRRALAAGWCDQVRVRHACARVRMAVRVCVKPAYGRCCLLPAADTRTPPRAPCTQHTHTHTRNRCRAACARRTT
jgi:hypothetical protein